MVWLILYCLGQVEWPSTPGTENRIGSQNLVSWKKKTHISGKKLTHWVSGQPCYLLSASGSLASLADFTRTVWDSMGVREVPRGEAVMFVGSDRDADADREVGS